MPTDDSRLTDMEFQLYVFKAWITGFGIPYWFGIYWMVASDFDEGLMAFIGYAGVVFVFGRWAGVTPKIYTQIDTDNSQKGQEVAALPAASKIAESQTINKPMRAVKSTKIDEVALSAKKSSDISGLWLVTIVLVLMAFIGTLDNNAQPAPAVPSSSNPVARIEKNEPSPKVQESRRYRGGRSAVTYDVQFLLQQRGYYKGPVDGVYGPATGTAINSFQRDNGLEPNGKVSIQLRDFALKVE